MSVIYEDRITQWVKGPWIIHLASKQTRNKLIVKGKDGKM